MKHRLDELLGIVYRYYPRGVGSRDHLDDPRIKQTEEHARLVVARQRAATDERWHAMRRRISERFPDAPLMNHSLHLSTGDCDACYSFTISPPRAAGPQDLWFQVSFLAPYYLIHSSRRLDVTTQVGGFRFVVHGVQFHIPRDVVRPALMSNLDDKRFESVTSQQRHVTFDLALDERPYAEWIVREIETTFGCEYMPPDIGTVLVPDVATNLRLPGEVRLYDCLFSDDHEWVNPSPPEVRPPFVDVDASHLTDRFIAVVTVLAALHQILLTLMPEAQGALWWSVMTDGVLHKEEVVNLLAQICQLIEPPATPRGIAARCEIEATTREFEAFIAAWDDDAAPSDAMVTCASHFLANWIVSDDSD